MQVWFARLLPGPHAERLAWMVLTPEERARANRLGRRRDRALQVGTRALMRRVLGAYLEVAPQDVAIGTGPNGKPEIAGGDTSRWPRFNVSHSGSLALMALSARFDVGIDVERVSADLVWRDVANEFFSSAEVGAIDQIPRADRRRAFFDCWVRKEAYLKGLGVGLRRATTDFAVPVLGTGGPVDDRVSSRPEAKTWYVHGLDVERGYAAAIAVDGEASLTMRSWASVADG